MMVFLNMFPVNQPEVMIGNAADRFDANGNLTDDITKDYIRKLLQALVEWTARIQMPAAWIKDAMQLRFASMIHGQVTDRS